MNVIASTTRETAVHRYAKTSPPDAGLLLVRQRLHQLLDSGRRRIIWVSGPAGAGKSSLLAAWTLQYADALHWYRVDSDDRDIASFFDWFGKLLDPVQRAGLPHFDTTHILNVPHFARRFFRHAFSTFATDATLVLDNVQEAHDAPAFMQVMQTLVEERPPGLTLVLSSRHPPAEALLAHMAAPGNLHLGRAELSCSDQEALALAKSQGLPSPTPVLLQRAEGWMAALAVLLRQTQSKGSGIATADTSALADEQLFATFAAQAFASLSDAQQQCLLVNAYSPWIDAHSTQQLCPAVDAAQELDAV